MSPASCFRAAYFSSATDSNFASCSSAFSFIYSCSAETSQFISLDYSSQASCLCYSSGTWVPDAFDGFYSHCYSYYSTASPNMTVAGNGGVCTSVGNILSATASASTTGGAKGSVSSISASPSQTIPIVVATSIIATSTTTSASEAGMVGHQVSNLLSNSPLARNSGMLLTIRKLPVIVSLSCLVCQLVLAGLM
jgi:hypothetical protein